MTSTTSTTQNGSIIIRAETDTLLLGGPGDNPLYGQFGVAPQPSLLQIIPDPNDKSLITDTQAITNSSIWLTGVNVDIRGIVQLHGYDLVTPTAPTNSYDPAPGISITPTGVNNGLVGASNSIAGQVFLENGSLVTGSGTTDAAASTSRNSVAVQLRVNELSDLPVVAAGALYQQTIYVDASMSGTFADGETWQGTPLANANAWIALTTRSLDERMKNGAPITINGGASFISGASLAVNMVESPGAVINVSGGYLTYTPGFVRVSTLVNAAGQLVSASNADPNAAYIGICCSFTVNHPHWGVEQTYASPLMPSGYYDPGYIQGGAGGSVTLTAASAVLGGQIYSSVVSGWQLTPATAPQGAILTVNKAIPVDLSTAGTVSGTDTTAPTALNGTSYAADNMILSDAAAATAAQWVSGFTVGSDLNTLLTANSAAPNSVYLPASWLNSGFGNVSLGANARITLSAGNPIMLPAGSNLSLSANTVDVESPITAPGGTLTLTGAYTSLSTPLWNNTQSVVSTIGGLITIGPGVAVSTAGLWRNDVGASTLSTVATNGGTITLNSDGDINLGQGSVLDVSGGGHQTVQGKITSGHGGTLTLAAGLVPTSWAGETTASRGQVNFAAARSPPAQLRGYGVNASKGGALIVDTAAVVTIISAEQFSNALVTQLPVASDGNDSALSPVAMSTGFFSSGGFSSVAVTALGIPTSQPA